jgi:ribonuclease VapC
VIVDTSALLAILFSEPERAAFVERIMNAPDRMMSAANYVEAGIRVDGMPHQRAPEALDGLIRRLELTVAPVSVVQARAARDAYARFGRGNHPARLTYGDCFAYALAKTSGYPLLFKGNDFAQTDIAAA